MTPSCCEANARFWFPCLLVHKIGMYITWTQSRVKDLKHLSEKAKKQEISKANIENAMHRHPSNCRSDSKLSPLGGVEITDSLVFTSGDKFATGQEPGTCHRYRWGKLNVVSLLTTEFLLAVSHRQPPYFTTNMQLFLRVILLVVSGLKCGGEMLQKFS